MLNLKFRVVGVVRERNLNQVVIEFFAGGSEAGQKPAPAGMFRMRENIWLAFLRLILCGADHRGSWTKVEVEADGVTVELTKDVVSCPWEDPFDEWMHTVHASIYERSIEDNEGKALS